MERLRKHVIALSMGHHISILDDVTIEELKNILKRAKYGIHTMIDEHFGIGIVEMMSAGLVVLTHNSAGPRDDIIQRTSEYGFLCNTDGEYVDILFRLIVDDVSYTNRTVGEIAHRARQKCIDKFSNQIFEKRFVDACYIE